MNPAEFIPGLGSNGIILFLVIIADVILRGFALWFAARAGKKLWFGALLIINSMGILPLFYLIYFKHITPSLVEDILGQTKKKK